MKLLDYLKAAAGEVSLSSALGRWMQKVSRQLDSAGTSGSIGFFDVGGVELTGPLTVDTWFNLAPVAFTEGNLSTDLAAGTRSLIYSGSAKRLVVRAGVSFLATGGAVREGYEIGIFRNGVLIDPSSSYVQSTVSQAGASNAGSGTAAVCVILNPGDEIEIRMRQRVDGDIPTYLFAGYLVISE